MGSGAKKRPAGGRSAAERARRRCGAVGLYGPHAAPRAPPSRVLA